MQNTYSLFGGCFIYDVKSRSEFKELTWMTLFGEKIPHWATQNVCNKLSQYIKMTRKYTNSIWKFGAYLLILIYQNFVFHTMLHLSHRYKCYLLYCLIGQ